MGFYGNITNTSRTQFQFDRTYANRREMDFSRNTDGVYAGRYVLVEYDQETNLDTMTRASLVKNNLPNAKQEIQLQAYNVGDEQARVYIFTRGEVRKGDLFYVVMDDTVDPSVNVRVQDCQIYSCSTEYVEDSNEPALFIGLSRKNDGGPTTPYTYNYNIDIDYYSGAGRGYDSTVWQKVYSEGTEKYVMIAELNTVVPYFAVSADAPTMKPLVPHFDTASTDVYYKLHMQPQWGFRVKEAQPQDSGTTTDNNKRLSDTRVKYQFADYNPITNTTHINNTNYDGAIYFNKAGFNKDKYNSYEDALKDLLQENYSGKQSDEISIRPTGYSGNVYNDHNPGTEDSKEVDIQELIINLPTLGESLAEIWNIVYGYNNKEQNKANPAYHRRYLDIDWKDGNDNDDLERKLNVPMFQFRPQGENEEYGSLSQGYQTRDLNTFAGCINTIHDLIGMIITPKPTKSAQASVLNNTNYKKNLIYFDQSNKKFYRMYKYPKYEPVDLTFMNELNKEYPSDAEKKLAYRTALKRLEDTSVDGIYQVINKNGNETQQNGKPQWNVRRLNFNNILNLTSELNKKNIVAKIPNNGTDAEINRAFRFTFVELPELASGISTVLGTILDMKKSIELDDSETRDNATVQGVVNQLNDIIDLFKDIVPGEFMISGSDGTVKSASWTSAQDFSYKNHNELLPDTIDLAPREIDDIVGNDRNTTENRWISVSVDEDNNNIIFKHNFTAISDTKTSSNKNGTSDIQSGIKAGINNVKDDYLKLYTPLVDEKGHVVGKNVETVKLPFGYKQIGSNGLSQTNTSDLYTTITKNTNGANTDAKNNKKTLNETSTADNTQDKFEINTANKWVQIAVQGKADGIGNLVDNDKILLAHEIHAINEVPSTKTYNSEDTGTTLVDNTNTISVPQLQFDEAGHAVAHQICTYTMPYGFKHISTNGLSTNANGDMDNFATATITADTTEDEFALNTFNKWIQVRLTPNTDKIELAHEIHNIDTTPKQNDYNTEADKKTLGNDISFQDLEFDKAGHVTKNQKHTYTLPYGFKTIATTGANSSVSDMALPENSNTNIVADNVQDTFALNPANKWIKIKASTNSNNDNSISIAHSVNSIDTNGTGKTDLNNETEEVTLTINTIGQDEAGHIISNKPHVYALPYGYRDIGTDNKSATTDFDNSAGGEVSADHATSKLNFIAGNKWLQVKASKVNDVDSVQYAHEVHKINTTPTAEDYNNDSQNLGNNITVHDLEFDAAGHVTLNQEHTYTLPYGFKFVKASSSDSASGSSTNIPTGKTTWNAENVKDTIEIGSANRWITVDNSTNKRLLFGHAAPDTNTTNGSSTITDTATPNFGESVVIPEVYYDNTGHIYKVGTHNVTLPTFTISSSATNKAITSMAFDVSSKTVNPSYGILSGLLYDDKTTLSTKLSNLSSGLTGKTTDDIATVISLQALKNYTKKVETKVSTLESTVSTLNISLTALNNTIGTMSRTISSLQTRIEALEGSKTTG